MVGVVKGGGAVSWIFLVIKEPAVVYQALVLFIMNTLRTGARPAAGGVINEPGNVRFQETSLLPNDLRRTQGNPPQNLIKTANR